MTEDEKLEKKNSEILTLYRTAGDNINRQEIQENMMHKAKNVNIEPEKYQKKRN